MHYRKRAGAAASARQPYHRLGNAFVVWVATAVVRLFVAPRQGAEDLGFWDPG